MVERVDFSMAMDEMAQSLRRCEKQPTTDCPIRSTIDFAITGKNLITYSYILLTALVSKATNPSIDILSLSVNDKSPGAYTPREVAKSVVYEFQKRFLGNVIDGANNDPLVNKPARYPRLERTNAARGDGKRMLDSLVENLPRVKDAETARTCLDYYMTLLLKEKKQRDEQALQVHEAAGMSSAADYRKILDELLDKDFGGAALTLAVSSLYHIAYPAKQGWVVRAHPVNQPGNSSRQFSDLDLLRGNQPFLATELKDKPFTEEDVRRAGETGSKAGARSLLFITGRHSEASSLTPAYFNSVRQEFAERGMYVGISPVDPLMDTILCSHPDIDTERALTGLYRESLEVTGGTEAQMWLFDRMRRIAGNQR